MSEQTFLDDFGFEHTYAPGKCLCGLTHAGDLIGPALGEQAPEKDGAEIEADIAAGRVERFDSMPEAIEGLREQAEPVCEVKIGENLSVEFLWKTGDVEPGVYGVYTEPPLHTSSKEADGCEGLREALRDLVAALDACQPGITAAFTFAHIHGQRYDGPTYEVELKAARKALAAQEQK